ncbi:M48 family metallopeptidase [Aliarcobacter cryaerophilus]|uniref:M48 family metallopeptidase n=1 Tax=Aliarcobacter cryaerophilus TaxID=28198 RepID=UPI0021B55E96|nr:SprT family zinc-dependent metalloprotease [Aliarcobacter cryaerophilus]MCT7486192.1 M48 family metallopeptidase [Aliarcobacter cryaerophilus]MCT7490255.1 M48 family metallopeptidase [Aliarcobacter cryaerophilus]
MIPNFTIQRSNRKTIALKVTPEGILEVAAPNEVTNEDIENIVNKKKFWLYKTVTKIKEKASKSLKKEFISGELFWYLGKRYRLDISNDFEHRGLKFLHNKFLLNNEDRNKARQLFKEFYKQKAKEKVEAQVQKYAKQMGVQYKELKFLDMKKRWGSCTNEGNIILNSHLIKAPIYVIDYVIVHELAHLIEYNHSPRFWNIVRTQISDYEEHKKWLDKLDIEV